MRYTCYMFSQIYHMIFFRFFSIFLKITIDIKWDH